MSDGTLQPVRTDVSRLQSALPDAILKVKEYRGDTFVCVVRERIVDVVTFLKCDADLEFDYFVECLGVDYSAWTEPRDLPERFEVVYNLMSLKLGERLFIKVGVNDGQKVPTLKHVFLGAEYPEREIWDLFGVVFEGNEQKQRFLLPDDWVGHPLRKEVSLGGDEVLFDKGESGPAVADVSMPHAGESFEGKTGSEDISGR